MPVGRSWQRAHVSMPASEGLLVNTVWPVPCAVVSVLASARTGFGGYSSVSTNSVKLCRSLRKSWCEAPSRPAKAGLNFLKAAA